MWKIAVGFVVFAAIALYVLFKGGDIDMGGEKHGTDDTHAPAVASSSPPTVAVSASKPASAP